MYKVKISGVDLFLFFPSLPPSISLETIAPVRCCMHTVCILFVQICKYSYGRASVIHKSVNRWVYYVAYVNFHWTNFQYVNVWHHHNMLESSHVSFASPSDWRVTLLQKGLSLCVHRNGKGNVQNDVKQVHKCDS